MALQEEKPTRNYNCTQTELYAVCLTGLKSFRENLADFSNFKGYYSNAWANDFEQEIKDAKKLKGQQQRTEPSESGRIKLVEKSDECLVAWQRLKRHIADVQGWEKLQKPKLEAAGQLYYETAANENWEDLQELMDDGESFITDNLADLTANQNMPPAFHGQFSTLKTEFDTLYNTFTDVTQDAEEETSEKINANNALNGKLMGMFKDGQEIYRKDRAKQERFIFDMVLEIVRGAKGKTKSFTVEPSSKLTVARVVANSAIENTGQVTLWVNKGEVETQTPSAVQLDPESTIDVPDNSKTITIFNNDTTSAGTCNVRVTVD